MDKSHKIILFSLDRQHYGIPLAAVDRVVRMVEITPLPGSPPFVRGVINVQGAIIPVVDLRLRFALPSRPVKLTDQLLIVHLSSQSLALIVDSSEGVCDCRQDSVIATEDLFADGSGRPCFSTIAKSPEGLILIQDVTRLLSDHELQVLFPAKTEDVP